MLSERTFKIQQKPMPENFGLTNEDLAVFGEWNDDNISFSEEKEWIYIKNKISEIKPELPFDLIKKRVCKHIIKHKKEVTDDNIINYYLEVLFKTFKKKAKFSWVYLGGIISILSILLLILEIPIMFLAIEKEIDWIGMACCCWWGGLCLFVIIDKIVALFCGEALVDKLGYIDKINEIEITTEEKYKIKLFWEHFTDKRTRVKLFMNNIYGFLFIRNWIENKYPGIDKYGYDVVKYETYSIMSLCVSIKTSIENIYKKDAFRQQMEWWKRLDPYDFEQEVAKWFRLQGYKANVTQKSGDGGVDIVLYKDNKLFAYVQCKHYKSQVPVGVCRELYGVMQMNKVEKGFIVALNGMTSGATDIARKCGLEIITAKNLADTFIKKDEIEIHCRGTLDTFFVENFAVLPEAFESKNDACKYIYNNREKKNEWENGLYFILKKGRFFFILNCTETNFRRLKYANYNSSIEFVCVYGDGEKETIISKF